MMTDDVNGQANSMEEVAPTGCGGIEKPFGYRFVKRLFDIVFSVFVIVVGLIPGLILAVLIMLDTKGSPFYVQERVGRGGKPFNIIKFRSMVADADNVEKYLSSDQLEMWRQERKVDNDPRITKLGDFLRKTSIDEFPQFLNVLVGQMSVIGPRAITFEELAFFEDHTRLLLSMSPGITGLWQTGLRNDATFESGLRQKIELQYIENACFSLDAKLFFKTFAVMLVGKTGR